MRRSGLSWTSSRSRGLRARRSSSSPPTTGPLDERGLADVEPAASCGERVGVAKGDPRAVDCEVAGCGKGGGRLRRRRSAVWTCIRRCWLRWGGRLPRDRLLTASILRAAAGETIAPRSLFWHYPHYGNQGGARRGGGSQWRVEDDPVDGDREGGAVRDREGSVGEPDVAANHIPVVAELTKELEARQKGVGATYPVVNPGYKAGGRMGGPRRSEVGAFIRVLAGTTGDSSNPTCHGRWGQGGLAPLPPEALP